MIDWQSIGIQLGIASTLVVALIWFLKKSNAWDNHLVDYKERNEKREKWEKCIDDKMGSISIEIAETRKSLENCWEVVMHGNLQKSPYFESRSPLRLKDGIECKVAPEISLALKDYPKGGSRVNMLNYLLSKAAVPIIAKNAAENGMNIFEFIAYLEEKVV